MCTLPESVDSVWRLVNDAGEEVDGVVHASEQLDLVHGFIRFVGTYTITGGTGRFEGATGTGTYATAIHILSTDPTLATVTGDGTIDF
jgi:hypothetical protein